MAASVQLNARNLALPLGMTKSLCLVLLLLGTTLLAQERSVRISFIPPPLDGTISLGIYNQQGQLVRVLHQEATLDEFTIGPDALITKWDGKDDFGYDLPSGKYSARGFLVAGIKVDEVTPAGEPVPTNGASSVTVKLMANPLQKSERPTVELSAAVDDEDVLLRAGDGLPLATIAQIADAKSAVLTSEPDAKMVTAFVTDGTGTRRFNISGINRMMAFNCGEFELK